MKYTDYLRWVLLIGLSAVPFVAFIVAGGSFIPSLFFPFITGKNFVFRILIELLLLAYVILAIKEPKVPPESLAYHVGDARLYRVDGLSRQYSVSILSRAFGAISSAWTATSLCCMSSHSL